VLLHRLELERFEIFFVVISSIEVFKLRNSKNYWQASQPTSSMAVNLTSVAGTAESWEGAAALEVAPPDAAPEDTAFIWLLDTVDFSACVALMVRK